MDLESALRQHIMALGGKGPHPVTLDTYLNSEKRVCIGVNIAGSEFPTYVVVGDNALQLAPKIPAQRLLPLGWDAHKGMGARE